MSFEQLHKKRNQQDRILDLLRQRDWVSLPEILGLYIACYTKRISELRKRGYVIEMGQRYQGHARHTWYKLVSEPSQ